MMRTIRRLGQHDDDPLSGIANLFDVGIVLSLGFMVAAMVRTSSGTATRSPQSDAAIAIREISKDRASVLHNIMPSRDTLSGEGERLGVAYRLKSGEVVYVPESELPKDK